MASQSELKDSNEPKWEDTEPTWDETFDVDESEPHEAELAPDAPTQGEAVLRGAGQGLTLGWGDEAAAGIQAGLDVATSDKKMSDLMNLYNTYKKLQQERESEVEKAYPKTYMASEIAGGLPTIALPGGQANTAKQAMTLGGIMGLGKSKASLTDIPGQVMNGEFGAAAQNAGQATFDTGFGSVLGYGGYKVGEKIGNLMTRSGAPDAVRDASDGMKQEAQDLALDSLDASRKALEKEHGKTWRADPDYRKGVGEEALNKLSVFGGADKMRAKVIEEVDQIEAMKKPLMDHLDQSLKQKLPNASIEELSQLSENAVANQLANLRKEMTANKSLLPGSQESIDALGKTIDDYATRISGRDMDIHALNEVKKALNQSISDPSFAKVASDLPEQAQMMLKIRDIIVKRIDQLADFAGSAEGKLIKDLNRKESNLYDLGNIVWRKETKPSGSQLMQGGDFIAGGIGAGIGNYVAPGMGGYPGFIAGVTGKKLLERLTGNSIKDIASGTLAKGLNRASQFGQNLANTIESAAPYSALIRPTAEKLTTPDRMSRNIYQSSDEELGDVVEKLNSNPKFGDYGMALADAITNKSSDKKNAVLFTIMQNPEMRKLIYPSEEEVK